MARVQRLDALQILERRPGGWDTAAGVSVGRHTMCTAKRVRTSTDTRRASPRVRVVASLPESEGIPMTRSLALAGLTLACSALLGAPAGAQDLNGNFVQDAHDLRNGTSIDCNLNGFVDERDVDFPHFRHSVRLANGLEQSQNDVFDAEPIDFDQDGDPDLVVASMYSTNVGAISYWRNDGGSGLVHLNRVLTSGTRPYALEAADLNGDGLEDFVAVDSSFNRAYVYRATGPETFAAPVTLDGPASNNGSVGLELGDVDLDGDVDVLFSSWGLDSVHLFLNSGFGEFAPPVSFPVEYQPRELALGDIDQDGLPDLAVTNEYYSTGPPVTGGTVSILRNLGGGAFQPWTVLTLPDGNPPFGGFARPQFVTIADVDGDGDGDVLTSSNDSNNLVVHSFEAGVFTETQVLGGINIESDPRDLLLRDLDGDGLLDLIWGDRDQHAVSVWRNQAGTFVHHQNFAGDNYGPLAVDAADFTGDGRLDLVLANSGSRTFSILPGKASNGGLDFQAVIHLRPDEYPDDALLADFTGDGLTDLGVSRFTTEQVYSVYPGLGKADFSTVPVDTPMPTMNRLFARDFDQDGLQDVLSVGGHCVFYAGQGDGGFAAGVASGLSVTSNRKLTIDLNADGVLDLAWIVGGHPSLLRVSLGTGDGTFGPYTEYTDVAEDESIGAGDITGDGAPEVFSGHRGGILSIHPNLGDGTFGVRRDIVIQGSIIPPAIGAIAVADFDGDGDNDVVVSGFGLHMFFNPGDGNLPDVPVSASSIGASTLVVDDIDLDGDPDLYGRGAGGIAYINPGTGFFAPPMFFLNYDSNARWLIVGDADNDGRTDAMIKPQNSLGHYLYLNKRPRSKDVNGNGVPDECETILPGPRSATTHPSAKSKSQQP